MEEELNIPPILDTTSALAMLDLLTDVDIQIVQRHQSAGHVVLAHTEISTTAAAQIASGGTKRIYSAEQACPHSVLCLPNPIDTPQTTRDKWRTTLHEPYNTGLVRSLKIPCLPVEEIVTVQVDQVHFPAILMSDYRHLPLTVLDHKNPKRNKRNYLNKKLNRNSPFRNSGFFYSIEIACSYLPVDNSLDKPCGFAIIQARKGNEITE